MTMMTTDNKTYLNNFPLAAFIVAICTTGALLVIDYFPVSDNDGVPSLLIYGFLTRSGMLLGLGIMLKEMKATLSAIGALVVCELASFLMMKSIDVPGPATYLKMYLMGIVLGVIPFLLFLIIAGGKWRKEKIGITLLVLFLLQFALDNQSATMALTYLSDEPSAGTTPMLVFRIVFGFAGFCTTMIAIAELMNFIKAESFINRIRLLNLANSPAPGGSTLAFWVLKLTLLLYCVSLGLYAKIIPEYFGTRAIETFRLYFATYIIFSMTGIAMLILGITWYLRKLMFEHLLVYNLTSRIWIWLFSLPFIGLIPWIISLLTGTRQTSLRDRKATLDEYASGSAKSVLIITGICYLLMFINNISKAGFLGGIVVLFAAGLYFLYASHRAGFYILAWLQALLCIFALFTLISHAGEARYVYSRSTIMATLVGAGAIGLVYTMLQLPVFHPEMFEYIPAQEETEEKQEGEDLFADYRLN